MAAVVCSVVCHYLAAAAAGKKRQASRRTGTVLVRCKICCHTLGRLKTEPLLNLSSLCLQTMAEACARPGCTILTVSALVCTAERDRLYGLGAHGIARQLLQHGGWLPQGEQPGEAWAADMLVSELASASTAGLGWPLKYFFALSRRQTCW